MTGSVALDVVIGLVFIFLLYSLLASIIQEIIANLLGLRARNLRHALTRMLEDDKYADKGESNIAKRFAADTVQVWKRNVNGAKKELLKEFYKQPIIKYLASGRYYSKPSYIDQSDFSKAIMGILKEKGARLLKYDGEDDDVALIDKIETALNDKDNTLIEEETKKHLKDLLENSQNDLQKFEANLEEWFNNMMERASGWYKKTTQFNLFVIGFIIAALFNINAIAITKALSTDEDARDAMVELATNFVEENKTTIEEIQSKIDKAQETKTEQEVINPDLERNDFHTRDNDLDEAEIQEEPVEEQFAESTFNEPEDKELLEFEEKLDNLLEVKANLEDDMAAANNILGYKPVRRLPIIGDLSDSIPMSNVKKIKASLNTRQRLISYKDTAITRHYVVEFPSASLAKNTAKYYYMVDVEGDDKSITTYAKLNDWRFFWGNFSFWGYLITALAISLGAAFWFDLLNKLIRFRGSIQSQSSKPQASKTAEGTVPVNKRVG